MGKSVFISYSHQQGEWVWNSLVPCLKAGGAAVIIDRERAVAGRAVIAQMDEQQNEAEINLLMLSPDYLVSSYCLHEMDRAIARDPNFQNGTVIPVKRIDCAIPDKISKPAPLYMNLSDDKDTNQWDKLLQACDADLGATAPDWLKARDEIVRYLQRGDSVNFVVPRKPGFSKPKWRELILHVQQSYPLALGIVDLADGTAASRRGLVTEILKALGSTTPVPPKPEDLVTLAQNLSKQPNPARIALLRFDMVTQHEDYKNDVALFAALRNLIMEKRKLILLIHSRLPFIEFLPKDHPLSSITDLKIIELHGRL